MAKNYAYLIERKGPTDWDEYAGAVVVAANEDDARRIHPSGHDKGYGDWLRTWVRPYAVKVTKIGPTELEPGVLLSDFKAG